WSTSKTPSYTKSVSWQHHLRLFSRLFFVSCCWNRMICDTENDYQDHSHLKLLARVMISPGKQLAVAVSRRESVKTIKILNSDNI
ncbi:hypothetical protein, partial [Klebsiella aerogenes]|uniref:hypothetical protein n=1 Tax=Klebsiella aerogenes TaxID=548 RepID=UPI001C640A6B